jgi:hypothetical protein
VKTDIRTPEEIAADALAAARAHRRVTRFTIGTADAWKVAQDAARRTMTTRRGFTADDRHDVASDALLAAVETFPAYSAAGAPTGTGRPADVLAWIAAAPSSITRLDADAPSFIRRHVDASRKRMERERAHVDTAAPVDTDAVVPNIELPREYGVSGCHRRAVELARDIAPTRRPVDVSVYTAAYYALRNAEGASGEEIAAELGVTPGTLRNAVSRGYKRVASFNAAADLREYLTPTPDAHRKPHAAPASTPWRQSGPMSATLVLDSFQQRAHAAMNAAAGFDADALARRLLAAV